MRFKKGSKVEVLCESEVPSGAWRCAEIVFGNGQNYTVKFDHSMGRTSETVVERVPRKAIRPCPPPMGCEKNWVAGAVVEVFHDFSWKSAIVLKVLVAHYYLVRLLGSSREFEIHKVKMRVRQCWQGNKWIVIGKGPWSSEVVKSTKISTSNPLRKTDLALMGGEADLELQAGRTSVCINNTTDFQESQILSVRKLKRVLPFDCFSAEAGNRCIKKVRVIAKDSETQPCSSGNPSSRLNKGQFWRHSYLASKGLKVMLGFTAFSLVVQERQYQHPMLYTYSN